MKLTLRNNMDKLESKGKMLEEVHKSMLTISTVEYTRANTQYKGVQQEQINKLKDALDKQILCRNELLTESRSKLRQVYMKIFLINRALSLIEVLCSNSALIQIS